MSEQKIKRVRYIIGPEARVKLEFESGDFTIFDPIDLMSDMKDAKNEILGSD